MQIWSNNGTIHDKGNEYRKFEIYIASINSLMTVVKPFETRSAISSTKKSPGFCITCGKVATTEALFRVEGAIIIQRFCDKCLPKADYEIGTH